MNSKYKISIILPIFNVEKYLKAALDSIINQTIGFENLEVIMVDDCSTDESGKIIDEYANKYENFIAIHLDENTGTAGTPRNIGLDRASSDYVMFLDPDDEFMPDICEKLYRILLENDADAVIANAITILGGNEVIDITYPNKFYEINCNNKDLNQYKPFRVWGTLFKKRILDENNLRFIPVSTNEDSHFNLNFYFHSNKMIYLNDYMGVKHYERDLKEHVSLSYKIDKNTVLSTIDAFAQILILIKNSHPKKDYVNDPYIKAIFYRFERKWDMPKEDKKEIFKKILEYENNSKYNIDLAIHYKIMNFFLKHKMFNILIIIQDIYSSFIRSNFIQKRFISKNKRNIIK